jgi:hypothetical protein
MKTKVLTAIVASVLMSIFGLSIPIKAYAEVNVDINIPLPGLIISAPPAMMVIPGPMRILHQTLMQIFSFTMVTGTVRTGDSGLYQPNIMGRGVLSPFRVFLVS